MPSLVEIQYNPYLPQVNVLIDKRQPANYSRLIQYSDEDIWEWVDEIFDALYAEIRDDYYLSFTGYDFDAEILSQRCVKDKHCIGFKKKDFIVADSIQAKLGKLNQFIKKAGITTYEKTIIDAYFYISSNLHEMMEEINSIDINNLFCAVRTRIVEAKQKYEEDENSILFIIVENLEEGKKILDGFNLVNPAYVIVIGQETQVVEITKEGFFLGTSKKDIFDTLFKCFLQRPLVISLRNCIRSIKGGNKVSKELSRIISIEPIVNVSVDSEVEVGRSIKVRVSLEPNVGVMPNLIFKMRNQELASCDGINVYGLKEGTSVLEVYKIGSSKPLFEKSISVFRRNRITRLIFSDDSILMGVGDNRRIKLDYYPKDADNKNEIVWKSSDDSIITVDHDGRLIAKNVGKCRIICTAENVSAQCTCTVMPYMEELDFNIGEDGVIHMAPMQEIVLSYKAIPEDCIDKKLIMISSDLNVVNVVNGTLYAKNKGNAQITIKNESGRISRTLEVVVGRYGQAGKKGGFFKKLFS